MRIPAIDFGLCYLKWGSIGLLEMSEGRYGLEGISGGDDEHTVGDRWQLEGQSERSCRVAWRDVGAQERQRLVVASGCRRERVHRIGDRLLREYSAYGLWKHDPRWPQADDLDAIPSSKALCHQLVELLAETIGLRGPQRVVLVDRKIEGWELRIRVVDSRCGHAAAHDDPLHACLLGCVKDVPGTPNVGVEDYLRRRGDGGIDGRQVDHGIVPSHDARECPQIEYVDGKVDAQGRVRVAVENVRLTSPGELGHHDPSEPAGPSGDKHPFELHTILSGVQHPPIDEPPRDVAISQAP